MNSFQLRKGYENVSRVRLSNLFSQTFLLEIMSRLPERWYRVGLLIDNKYWSSGVMLITRWVIELAWWSFHHRERLLFSNRAIRVLDHNTGGCAHSHDRKTEIRFPVECTDRKIILFRATKSLTAEKLFFRTILRVHRFRPFLPRQTNQVRNRESSSFWNPTRRILNCYPTWLRKFREKTIYYSSNEIAIFRMF